MEDVKDSLKTVIRAYTSKDLSAVVSIEKLSYISPWGKETFATVLARKKSGAIVALLGKKVIGFLVIESLTRTYQILNLAVHPAYRRCSVGSTLLDWLEGTATRNRRTKINIEVREGNLSFQLFLRACGYKAVEILSRYYNDTKEDCYRFEKEIIDI